MSELSKYYNKFVKWHFLKLKKDYIKYGKRTLYFQEMIITFSNHKKENNYFIKINTIF